MAWYPAHFEYEDDGPQDADENIYSVWAQPDGSRYDYWDLPHCCQEAMSGLGKFDAELECPRCGEYWRAS